MPQAIEVAIQHHQAGRLAEAEALYREILAVDPDHFESLHLLGVISHQAGQHEKAVELIGRAIKQNPTAFAAHNNLGLAYRALDDQSKACVCFQEAVTLKSDYFNAQHNLACAFATLGRLDDAVIAFRATLALKPDCAEAYNNLGNVLRMQFKLDDAIACFQSAVAANPDFANAHFSLANAYQARGRPAEALAGYQEALALDPNLAEAHFCLGSMLQDQGILDEALACFETALSLKPDYVEARWAQAMSQLALVHGVEDAPEDFRTAFSRALHDLDVWFDANRLKDGFKAVGSQQPFFLAYHEENNRELLSDYGNLCRRLMKYWQDEQAIAPAVVPQSASIRVGIVSAHLHDQSVWTAIVRGWCQHLDPDRFSLHLFYIGTVQDDETRLARSRAAHFVQGPKELRGWVDAIVGQHVDVLIYPEIGMDPMTAKLANLRLAPVQVAAWGHPETTGLPTIDYYVSAEDFEPADAQDNYRERLIALPHLGCSYRPLQVTAVDLDLNALGIDSSLPVLLCPGTPFKYAPHHDWIFVDIARRLGRCQFVFFDHFRENLSEKLQQRLDDAFERAGLYFPEHAVYLPWLTRPVFFGLMRRSDIYLDTIGFSGFNTAMQAIECGLPIVALEGRFMRGRLASGLLKRMGLSDLIAHTEQEYADLAVRLGQDQVLRNQVRQRIETARHILFEDLAPIRALEEFLVDVSGRKSSQ